MYIYILYYKHLQRERHRNAFAVFIIPLRPKQLKQTYRVGADCSGVYIVTVIAGATSLSPPVHTPEVHSVSFSDFD